MAARPRWPVRTAPPLVMLWALWVGLAAAELPPTPYDAELGRRAWERVYDELQGGDAEAAREHARAYVQTVQQTAPMHFLIGAASMELGDTAGAFEAYRSAVSVDSTHTASWIELGELSLALGDLDTAKLAFDVVRGQRVIGRDAWLGPLRLAEIAALHRDADTFEDELREALLRGFDLGQIANDPLWHQLYNDPHLHDSVTKMLVVYGDARTRDRFDPEMQAPL